MPPLAVTTIALNKLQRYHRNPRRGNTDAITESLRHLGQYRPIVVNQGTHTGRPYEVLAGNHTLLAAQELGWDTIDIVTVDVDDDTAARIVLVDNRTADLATNDDEVLTAVLADLPDLTATGYTEDDLAALLNDAQASLGDLLGEQDEEPAPEPPADPLTKPGDLWVLGDHRLLCGDSRDPKAVARLLDGAAVDIAFTSPPYASQRTYDETSGFKPIPPAEYVDWFESVQANVRAHLTETGSWFVNIKEHCENGQRHLYVKELTIAHVRRWGWLFVDELCWMDTMNGVPGSWPNRFKDAWEPVFHYARPGKIKFNAMANATPSNDAFEYAPNNPRSTTGSRFLGSSAKREMGEGLARPSNVLHLAAAGNHGLKHSAVFPVPLPQWFIRAYSDPGDVVFDPFMGAGSTLLAADREQRIAYGTEISPAYCDVICARWQKATGQLPRLEGGQEHDFAGR